MTAEINMQSQSRDFKPLERKSLAERIADELRDLVLLEKLNPGASIPERETAEALGVSRTPLRESLRILASEGLVEIEPNRPPRVANPSLDEIKNLLQVQGALEGLAGALACENATDAEVARIRQVETMMRESSTSNQNADNLAFFQLDMQFHEAIVAASGNAALRDTHRNYNSRLWRARFISSRLQVNRAGTLSQHTDIVEALEARNANACSDALEKHLATGYHNISNVFVSYQSGVNNES